MFFFVMFDGNPLSESEFWREPRQYIHEYGIVFDGRSAIYMYDTDSSFFLSIFYNGLALGENSVV